MTQRAGWAASLEPHTGVWIEPIDGWGFFEAIDNRLAVPFEVIVDEAGVKIGDGIRGWRGRVLNSKHKYGGMRLEMTPRHVEKTGVVVIRVSDGDQLVFSGMADTIGLERDWE